MQRIVKLAARSGDLRLVRRFAWLVGYWTREVFGHTGNYDSWDCQRVFFPGQLPTLKD